MSEAGVSTQKGNELTKKITYILSSSDQAYDQWQDSRLRRANFWDGFFPVGLGTGPVIRLRMGIQVRADHHKPLVMPAASSTKVSIE